jgi:hypothetical protein
MGVAAVLGIQGLLFVGVAVTILVVFLRAPRRDRPGLYLPMFFSLAIAVACGVAWAYLP